MVNIGLPNLMDACIPIPTSLNIGAWAKLAVTPEDERVVSFLTYSFLARHQCPVPSPSTENHASAKAHNRDIAVYITTELDHGAMLGPFESSHTYFHLNARSIFSPATRRIART